MEDWLDSGKLSQEEFVQLVRLTARYLYWDVDQFDHWEMPMPEYGPMFVDFSQHYPAPGACYRPMWPAAAAAYPAWTVWCQEDGTARGEMGRFATEEAARAHAKYIQKPGIAVTVTPPPPPAVIG